MEKVKLNFPPLVIPDGFDSMSYLRHLIEQGFQEKRSMQSADEQRTSRELIEQEFKNIRNAHHANCWLLSWHRMKYAREQGYLNISIGAGSVVGEVPYLLNITDTCPVTADKYAEQYFEQPVSKDFPLDSIKD